MHTIRKTSVWMVYGWQALFVKGFFGAHDAHAAPVRLALWFPKRSEE
jgi:hypothetical protein